MSKAARTIDSSSWQLLMARHIKPLFWLKSASWEQIEHFQTIKDFLTTSDNFIQLYASTHFIWSELMDDKSPDWQLAPPKQIQSSIRNSCDPRGVHPLRTSWQALQAISSFFFSVPLNGSTPQFSTRSSRGTAINFPGLEIHANHQVSRTQIKEHPNRDQLHESHLEGLTDRR